MPESRTVTYLLLAVACLAAAAASLGVGTCGESILVRWGEPGSLHTFTRLTLPRLVMGMVVGAALSVAGTMFQALFRNPLACPYTLGVSSGASLGACVAILVFGGGLWHGWPVVGPAALIGALVCMVTVYAIARLRSGCTTGTLLLAGISIGFVCSAVIVLLLFLARTHNLRQALMWMMGSLDDVVGFDGVLESLIMIVPAAGVAAWLHRDLDLLMMGEAVAAGRGVDLVAARRLVYVAASLMTAGVVARCGPIGFVGLIVPHAMRSLVGSSHRLLIPACALAGATFLPLCDLLARNAMWWLRQESRELPVGVLTSLVGGAFFLYLLLTRRGDRPML